MALHALPRLAHCARPRSARSFLTLPDLSSLSPFSGQDGGPADKQVYHERKIFPYVARTRTQTIRGRHPS